MSGQKPKLIVFGGCNGAGKTTIALRLLPQGFDCHRFLNADLIAAGLAPLEPASQAYRASTLMIKDMRANLQARRAFAMESTLASRSPMRYLKEAAASGYHIYLHYLLLDSVELARQRVADRVRRGGHHIPDEDLTRRFTRSRTNFIDAYRTLADDWVVWNNSRPELQLIAYGGRTEQSTQIINNSCWSDLLQASNRDDISTREDRQAYDQTLCPEQERRFSIARQAVAAEIEDHRIRGQSIWIQTGEEIKEIAASNIQASPRAGRMTP